VVPGFFAALEPLDDVHAAAAARTFAVERVVGIGVSALGGSRDIGHEHVQELARGGDVLGFGGCKNAPKNDPWTTSFNPLSFLHFYGLTWGHDRRRW